MAFEPVESTQLFTKYDAEETERRREENRKKGLLKDGPSPERVAEGSALLSRNKSRRSQTGIVGTTAKLKSTGYSSTNKGPGFGAPVRKTTDLYNVIGHLSAEEKDGFLTNTVDFLFGPEAAVIGIAHDSTGWSWSVDNARQQWSEQPLWVNALATTSLVGTMMMPAALAVKSTFKVGRMATKMKMGTLLEKAEIDTWQKMGMLEEKFKGKAITKYDDLDPETVILLRKQEVAVNSYKRMKARAEKSASDVDLNPWEKMRHEFDKRFAQTYNALVDDAANGGIKGQFHEMHNKLWQNDTVGTILREMPDEKEGAAIYSYLLGRIAPGSGLAKKGLAQYGKLSEKSKAWADFYFDAAKTRQAEMLKSGFITQDTFNAIGPAHLPALKPGTPDHGIGPTTTHYVGVAKGGKKEATGIIQTEEGFKAVGEFEHVGLQLSVRPRTYGPTLMRRESSHADIFERLKAGDVITDPADVTMQGYMSDGILHSNFQFITDMVTKDSARWTASADIVKVAGYSASKMKKLGFISLENSGEGSAAILRRMIAKRTGKPEEALPWLKAEVYDGIFGVDGMMHQVEQISGNLMDVMTTIYKTMKTAGSIPTHIQNLTGNMSFLAQAGFNVTTPKNIALMGRMTGAFNDIAKIRKTAKEAGMTGRAMFDKDGVLKGIDLGSYEGLNLADEFFDPAVRELLEESAFDSVEGSAHLARMADMLAEDQVFTKGVIKTYMKAKDLAQVGNKVKWFDGLTKAYLAEDMVPKMTYYIHLRTKGLSRNAAVTEVARRLPMYGTVGSSIKRGRKFAFPWATFPAEALRITKNNLQDHPLRMIPWLRAPQIAQSMFSGMGFAGDPGEVREAKRQLPFWAQSHTTLLGEGSAIAGLGGGATGGLVAGAAGAIIGRNPKAAYAAAAAGALVGGFAMAMSTDEAHAKQMRGAMLDFLPHSTFMMTTNSPDFGGNYAPWRNLQGLQEQLPAEPLAILKPMVSAFTGETAYGEPVGDGTIGGGISKTIAGMLGFMAPPIIQKYGFKLTTPDVQMWGDPTGITNISRLLVDTGSAIDPVTGRPGSMTNDFWLNNAGIFKSYAATGEQQLSNEAVAEQDMYKIRKHLAKNLDFHLNQGNDAEVVEILTEIQGSFSEQYLHSPLIAQDKYTNYLKGISDRLGQHPKLRQWSQQDILSRIEQAGGWAGQERYRARETLLESLRKEYRMKERGR